MSIPTFSGTTKWNTLSLRLTPTNVNPQGKCKVATCKPEMEISQAMDHTDLGFQRRSLPEKPLFVCGADIQTTVIMFFLPTVTHFSNFICHFPAFKVMPLQPVELSISAQFPVFDRQSTSEKSH